MHYAHPASKFFLFLSFSFCFIYFLDLRSAIDRINEQFRLARMTYGIAASQHHAALFEFKELMGVCKFIASTYPRMHTIGPAFKTMEAFRKFADLPFEEVDAVLALLSEHNLLDTSEASSDDDTHSADEDASVIKTEPATAPREA